MGVPSWQTSLVETIVEWWHSPMPYEGQVEPVRPTNIRWWFGIRWAVCHDEGIMHYDPVWRYYTNRQMAMKTLRETYGKDA